MDEDLIQRDPRLFALMEWLKENDESLASIREHANRNSNHVPHLIGEADSTTEV